MTARILIVEDELSIRTLLQRYLEQQGYTVEVAESGAVALEHFHAFQPNLVVLDLNLPDMNGYELCPRMQEETGVYVLMLTSRVDTADRLQGFHLGADDYITKPFNLPEVGARVAAILKRQRPIAAALEQPLHFQDLSIDPEQRKVSRGQNLIPLTALEFDLLYTMAQTPGRVWRRGELIEAVWEEEHDGDERVVDVHIGQIRKKIETQVDQPSIIRTVRGVGYKFEAPIEPVELSVPRPVPSKV
ncbi:response regulator transcription factor [Synechococcus sp. PCC 7336]|uniref:response regulator transcription factor n=1 Tax=Synechococcus sp. PCC 7336 TaxID=195250 RepID=UPI00034540A2|nr:response regulator transcription factor [Synechococcus sp. PCC 7336]